ncbi:MAG: hypothetical protein R3C41_16325 [Calditrichia bacterium]
MNTWDKSNEFVRVGARGGFITLLIFISLILYCFRILLSNLQLLSSNKTLQVLLWGLFAALMGHITAFFGVPYTDQVKVGFFLLLGIIGNINNFNFEIIRALYREHLIIKPENEYSRQNFVIFQPASETD